MLTNREFICPITHDVIEKAGITINGDVYDYNSITEWFNKSNIDPLRGTIIDDKTIIKIKGNYIDIYNLQWDIIESAKYDNSGNRFSQEINIYNITNKSLVATPNNMDRINILNPQYESHLKTFYKSNISKLIIKNKNFNKSKFYDCNIESAIFIGCTFLDTSFMNCNMNNVFFEKCIIGGYKTCFYESVTDNVRFKNCNFEYVHDDKNASYAYEIKKILRCRLFKGNFILE